MADDDLSELFPNLQDMLRSWQQPVATNGNGNGDTNGDTPPDHAGVTDADIDAYVQSRGGTVGPSPAVSGQPPRPPQFTPGQSAPPPVGGTEDAAPPQTSPQAVDDTAVQPVTPQPEDIPEEIVLGDVHIPRQRIEAYEQFDKLVQEDQQLRALLDSYLRTGQVPPELVGGQQPQTRQPEVVEQPPTVPRPEPPPLDLDDPSVRYLYEQQQALQERMNSQMEALQQGVQRTSSLQDAQAQQQQEAIVKRAMASFQQQHALSEQEMTQVHDVAARLNVLPSLLQGIDPITGAPSKPDPLAAVERTLELAYYSMPEYRNKAFRSWVGNQVQDQERKRKLGALSGSSGSVPRTQPAPVNEKQRQSALRQEVAEMFAGTWSAPE